VAGVAGPRNGVAFGDTLADAMMTAWTRAENRVTASLLGGAQGATDEGDAARVNQITGRSGEVGPSDAAAPGPRRIDPNRVGRGGATIRGMSKGQQVEQVASVAAGRDEVEGLTAEDIPEATTTTDTTASQAQAQIQQATPPPTTPAPAKASAPVTAPKPGGVPNAPKPGASPSATPVGTAPRPAMARPTPAPGKPPGAPKAPTPAPIRPGAKGGAKA